MLGVLPAIVQAARQGDSQTVQLLLDRLRDPALPTQIRVLPVQVYRDGTTAVPKAKR